MAPTVPPAPDLAGWLMTTSRHPARSGLQAVSGTTKITAADVIADLKRRHRGYAGRATSAHLQSAVLREMPQGGCQDDHGARRSSDVRGLAGRLGRPPANRDGDPSPRPDRSDDGDRRAGPVARDAGGSEEAGRAAEQSEPGARD